MQSLRFTIIMCTVLAASTSSASAQASVNTEATSTIATSDSTKDKTELSFDFFASGNMWPAFAPEKPLTIKELKSFKKQLETILAIPNGGRTQIDAPLKTLPSLLFGVNHLFKDDALSDADKKLAVLLAETLATTFDKPDLAIKGKSEVEIASGLQTIKNGSKRFAKTMQHLQR